MLGGGFFLGEEVFIYEQTFTWSKYHSQSFFIFPNFVWIFSLIEKLGESYRNRWNDI